MRFSKYQGIGNDFVMIADPQDAMELSPELVRRLCDRRFGIGGDGVIRVGPGDSRSDLVMDYVNSDGSTGEMCGNGIRCLAIFARDEGLTALDEIKVGTGAGIKVVTILEEGLVRVDMGSPAFGPQDVPVQWSGPDALHAKVELDDSVIEAACLSMGNPHAVIFVDDPEEVPLTVLGPAIEKHPMFPNGANAEFATVEGPDRVRMRVWERGAGETLACGTGACAVGVASHLLRDTSPSVTVSLPGGELLVEWDGSPGDGTSVFMTGPALKSFEGEIEL